MLAELAIVNAGRASLLPQPVDDSPLSPAAELVMRNLDRIHDQLMAEANAAKAEKRRLKLERRAKRRLEAARAVEPPTVVEHGLPQESVPVAAAAAPVAAEPVPIQLASLRY